MTEHNISPHIVRASEFAQSEAYSKWIEDIKSRYTACQAKAVVSVNAEMLRFYWRLGADIIRMQQEQGWGNGVIKQLSLDLRDAYRTVHGFSVRNLEYMKRWYAFYTKDIRKSHQAVAIFGNVKSQQTVAILQMPDMFALVPWGHHVEIIYKCSDIDEALFYIKQTAEGNWSREVLTKQMKSGLYQRMGQAITNYDEHLPANQSALAKSMLKSPYQFDFLDMRTSYTERELEDALVHNITRFLLELGQGFAFVGRQMELRMDDQTSFFPDLVFYHYKQKRFVVVELKTGEFVPEYAGKINFYVNAADELLRGKDDNASVGLLICKSAKRSVVEWSFRGIENPLGVATYELERIVDNTFEEVVKKPRGLE